MKARAVPTSSRKYQVWDICSFLAVSLPLAVLLTPRLQVFSGRISAPADDARRADKLRGNKLPVLSSQT